MVAGPATPTRAGTLRRLPTLGRRPGWPSRSATPPAWAALLNLSDAITGTDPAAGAEAARAAAAHSRQAGARDNLAVAVTNLAQALLMTREWESAERELAQAIDAHGLADIEYLACGRASVAALRGDTSAAREGLVRLADLRASEDPQDKSNLAVAEAFTAAASRQPAAALAAFCAAFAAAVRDAVALPSYRTQAQALSRRLASEDGAAPIISWLARLGGS